MLRIPLRKVLWTRPEDAALTRGPGECQDLTPEEQLMLAKYTGPLISRFER